MVDLPPGGQEGDEIQSQGQQGRPRRRQQQPERVPKQAVHHRQNHQSGGGIDKAGLEDNAEKAVQKARGQQIVKKDLIDLRDTAEIFRQTGQPQAAQSLVVGELRAGDRQDNFQHHIVQRQTGQTNPDVFQPPDHHPGNLLPFEQSQDAVDQEQADGIADERLIGAAGPCHHQDGGSPAPAVFLGTPDGQRVEEQGHKVGVGGEEVREDGAGGGVGDHQGGGQHNMDGVGSDMGMEAQRPMSSMSL